MFMKSRWNPFFTAVLILVVTRLVQPSEIKAQNSLISYQGRMTASGFPFNGTGYFKFALLTATNNAHQAKATATLFGPFVVSYTITDPGAGYTSAPQVVVSGGGGSGATASAVISGGMVTALTPGFAGTGYTNPPTVTISPPTSQTAYSSYWSNDGTSSGGSQPASAISLGVTNGYFDLYFGDTTISNMEALPSAVFNAPNLQLAIWFSDGTNAFVPLLPLQPLTPAPYAVSAGVANTLIGTLAASQLTGAISNAQLASGTITVNTSNGLAGGGTVALGGSISLTNSGVLSVTGDGSITAVPSTGNVLLASTGTNTATPNTLVKRDANAGIAVSNLVVSGGLDLGAVPITINAVSQPFLVADASSNVYLGVLAGGTTNIGAFNVGIGANTLLKASNANYNVAIGTGVLSSVRNANGNVAVGFNSLASNITGGSNVSIGYQSLSSSTNGQFNTAVGAYALNNNLSGSSSTAVGYASMPNNLSGSNNTALGQQTLYNNLTGSNNTALGFLSMFNNNSGNYNVGVGGSALYGVNSGSFNIALGYNAGQGVTTGSNNIDIGNVGDSKDNGVTRIGNQGTQTNTFISGITGVTAASGVAVYINANGQLGTLTSSARFKDDVHDMENASAGLYSLRPVTFHYKPGIDPELHPQFGLIAEEVDKVNSNLVARDDKGQVYTVRYEAVNAMLLNEFLKEHRKVEDLETRIRRLEEMLEDKAAVEKGKNWVK